MLDGTLQKISKLYHEYPRAFWTVIVITFIDRIGGSLLFPFFALYITSKFHVGMTDVGAHFAPEVEGVDMSNVTDSIRMGVTGKIIDVVDEEDGEHVEIFVE